MTYNKHILYKMFLTKAYIKTFSKVPWQDTPAGITSTLWIMSLYTSLALLSVISHYKFTTCNDHLKRAATSNINCDDISNSSF